MDPATAARLIELNRDFYSRFGGSFSATRGRLQPGVLRILSGLDGDESILDLGCGNGGLARELARNGHRGRYLGVDFSPPLLQDARSGLKGLDASFIQADLSGPMISNQWSVISNQGPVLSKQWAVVTCFAVLHHIPGEVARRDLLRTVHDLLAPGGRFFLSNWQFLNSEKLRRRIQPWEAAGLASSDVDPGDTLLDWKRDGTGLRYVHHFTPDELASLAARSGFHAGETFLSDGEGGRLGLYQIWDQ
jgi:SAM-dependent methyltransferase